MKRPTKWQLVQEAVRAKGEGRLADYKRLLQVIKAFEAACKHRQFSVAEDVGVPGDRIHLCTSCGRLLTRVPSELPSGVRLRV